MGKKIGCVGLVFDDKHFLIARSQFSIAFILHFKNCFLFPLSKVLVTPYLVVHTPLGAAVAKDIRSAWREELPHFSQALFHIVVARIVWELEQQTTNSIALFDWRGAADPALCATNPLLSWCHGERVTFVLFLRLQLPAKTFHLPLLPSSVLSLPPLLLQSGFTCKVATQRT